MTDLRAQIEEIVSSEPVALFMKGTPSFVMCGNSERALRALRDAGAPVTAVDILPDPQIRQELSALLGLADDSADLHRRRARRRGRHRRGARRER
jgi:glutaredoxin-related protein